MNREDMSREIMINYVTEDNDQHRGHSNNEEDTGHEQSPNIDKPYNPNDPNNPSNR